MTDEIKQKILDNRVYIIPKQPVITQIINYNNTIQNLIYNMDTIDKLQKYMSHHDVRLIECGDSIEQKFSKQIQDLQCENDTFGSDDKLILDERNLLDVIDQASSLANEHCENMNVIYDRKFDKLKLFDMGKWDELIVVNGISTLLTKIQEHYFDAYECYLIRKIESSALDLQSRLIVREKLCDYYRFIGCFKINPYVKDKNDTLIMYTFEDPLYNSETYATDDNTEMSLKYEKLYTKVVDDTNTREINKIKKTVIDIVKKNCLKNVAELNKKVVALFNMDEEFKNTILPTVFAVQGSLMV